MIGVFFSVCIKANAAIDPDCLSALMKMSIKEVANLKVLTVTTAEFRKNLTEFLGQVNYGGNVILIKDRNRNRAIVSPVELSPWAMEENSGLLTVADFRTDLSSILDRAQFHKQTFLVSRRGVRALAVVQGCPLDEECDGKPQSTVNSLAQDLAKIHRAVRFERRTWTILRAGEPWVRIMPRTARVQVQSSDFRTGLLEVESHFIQFVEKAQEQSARVFLVDEYGEPYAEILSI